MSLPLPNANEPAVGEQAFGQRWYDFLARVARAVNGPFELRALGCDMAQGFYLARPQSEHAIAALLAENKRF